MATSGMLPHSKSPFHDHQQLMIGWVDLAVVDDHYAVKQR